MTRQHAHVWQDRAARITSGIVAYEPGYYRRLFIEQHIINHVGKAWDWTYEYKRIA